MVDKSKPDKNETMERKKDEFSAVVEDMLSLEV